MGLFKKKKIGEIAANNDQFTSEPPITGGNSYEIKKQLEVQDLINKATIPKLNLQRYTRNLEGTSYNFYWLLQFQANYFVSIFPVKTPDHKLNKLIYECFRVHFLYGNCGIYKKGDLLIGVYEKRVFTNKLGEITKIEFALLNDLVQNQNLADTTTIETCFTLNAEELEKNYARLRTTSIGFGAIVTWLPFIKQQESLLKKIYMYSFIFHRKIAYKANDLSTSRDELDAFFNEDIPFYVELDADIGTGNKFSTQDIGGSTNGGVNELKEYYNFFIESYYHLLGRRLNVDTKKERNVSSEVEASQETFDVLHWEDKLVKTEFLDRVKEITGIPWEEEKQEKGVEDDSASNSNKQESRDKSNRE